MSSRTFPAVNFKTSFHVSISCGYQHLGTEIQHATYKLQKEKYLAWPFSDVVAY
jgi:hypothetical protein